MYTLAKALLFQGYMQRVNAALVAACGMNSDCLPDYKYYNAFDSGMTPKKCALAALEYSRSM